MVLLWQMFVTSIVQSVAAYFWSAVQISHFRDTGEWGGSVGWLITGVVLSSVGVVVIVLSLAVVHYCLGADLGCGSAESRLLPVRSLGWLMSNAGTLLMIFPVIRQQRAKAALLTAALLALGVVGFSALGGWGFRYV